MAGMGFGGMEAVMRAEEERCRTWRDKHQRCDGGVPCRHCDTNAEEMGQMLQAAKDRASTSYRQGYEAGVKAEAEARAQKEVADLRDRAAMDGQIRAVLASNPLDPKCASIFEAAEILASVTACMSKLAKALEEMSEKAEAAEKLAERGAYAERDLAEALASREHYRRISWEQDAQLADLKRQLGEHAEAWSKAMERAERAEAMLVPVDTRKGP